MSFENKIKQSDLINNDNKNLIDKYQDRLHYLQQIIFSDLEVKSVYQRLNVIKIEQSGTSLGNKIFSLQSALVSFFLLFKILALAKYLNI